MILKIRKISTFVDFKIFCLVNMETALYKLVSSVQNGELRELDKLDFNCPQNLRKNESNIGTKLDETKKFYQFLFFFFEVTKVERCYRRRPVQNKNISFRPFGYQKNTENLFVRMKK